MRTLCVSVIAFFSSTNTSLSEESFFSRNTTQHVTLSRTISLPSSVDEQLQLYLNKMLVHNYSLKQMFLTVKRLRSDYDMSRSAALPKIDLIAQAGKSDGNTVETIYAGDDFSFSVPVSYEIDVWKKLRSESESLISDRVAAEYDRQALSVTLAAELMTRYYTGLHLKKMLLLQDTLLQQAKQLTQLVSAKYEAGMVTRDELYVQKQSEKELDVGRLTLKNELVLIEHALNVLMGEEPQDDWLRGYFSIPSWLSPLPQDLSVSQLISRPNLLSLQKQMEAVGLRIKSTQSESLPSFFLTGYARNSAKEMDDFFDTEAFGWGAFIEMRVPLFEGYRNQAVREGQVCEQEKLEEEYYSLLLKALSEVKSALKDGQNQDQILKSLKERNLLVKNSLAITQKKYDAGMEDLLKVISEKQRFVFARMEQSKQQLQLIASRIQLFRALGKGWWE